MGIKALIFFSPVFLIGCGFSNEEFIDQPNLGLTGSWSLTSLNQNDSTFGVGDRPGAIIQKHLTKTHFAWLYYDSGKDRMIGMAGGTYSIQENQYVEVIDYYLPSGSNKLGRQIEYSYELDQEDWLCNGFDKIYDFDPRGGGIVPIDSTFLEQRWSRIIPQAKNDQLLHGTWALRKYRSETDSVWQTYPGFVGYLKLITPSHFFWIKYNSQYDEVMASGSGPYTYSGGSFYHERIESFYPHDSYLVGTEITFGLAMEGEAWGHYGYVKRIDRDVLIDSTLVDEIWNIYQKPKQLYGVRAD